LWGLCSQSSVVLKAAIAYISRRISGGKSRREANRCLKRYLGRNLYRLLEHAAMTT
jgi:hypothetical protein